MPSLPRPRFRIRVAALAAVAVIAGLAPVATADEKSRDGAWSVSWATAQHVAGPALDTQSVRMITHLTQGGEALRLRLGNTLGTAPLQVGAVSVAVRADGPRLVAGTLRQVTFGGSQSVAVPQGEYVVSDPVELVTEAEQDLAVSVFLPGPATPSAHAAAFETGYLTPARAGDRTAELDGASYTATTGQFLVVNAVDVRNSLVKGAVVVVGGSVTDGAGSEKTGVMGTGPAAPPNSRWSDVLARRVRDELPRDAQITVAQAGIGGNTISRDCPNGKQTTPYGNVQDRLDRDVLSHSGISHIVVYAGTNDLGFGAGCTAEQIIEAFRDVVRRAHAQGVRVVIATVTARAIYTPLQNEQRQLVNRWITRENSCAGECDGMVDFDAAVRWGAYPNAIDPRYDSGDDIHPNAEGYALMGQAIDMRLLAAGRRDAPTQRRPGLATLTVALQGAPT